ncbi:hypothetical protein L9F63_010376 [Diploptera punctata]|uniref:Gustatory receptor n=1 Tax=Diploptera punctata TaxID=6984 RepID=A0AAD8AK06_DIPPU|nr:hypothetical protein L9F63_010376 [Diploptera punctata]
MDIYKVAKPIIYISRIFGIAPFTYCHTGLYKLKHSTFWEIYSSFWALLIIFSLFVMIYTQFKLEVNEVYNFSSVVVIGSFVIAVFITQIMCLVNGNRVLETFKDIFRLCRLLTIQPTHYHYLKFAFIQNIISVGPFICTVIYNLYDESKYPLDEFLISLHCQIIWLCAFLIIWTVQSHFLCFVIIMYQCFSRLNYIFEQISITKHYSCCSLHKLSKFSNPLKASLNIAHIRHLHSYTCDLNECVENTYSLQILLTVVISFFFIIWLLYALIAMTFIPRAGKYFKLEGNYSFTNPTCIVFCIGKIMLNIVACTTTSNEANRTAILVHKLINKTRDPLIREELELFSLQLLHRKVQFTACGFFPLDFTLLYSIVGAVTTYLIILIQFQLTYETQESTTAPTFSPLNVINTTNEIST